MTMASLNKVALESDEEEDLEFLRLAALKSLKPKTTIEIQSKPPGNTIYKPQFAHGKTSTFGAAQTTRHHNRGFRNNPGRGGRNGINPRNRTNTNLIPIQTIDPDEPKELLEKESSSDIPKLILPQDRYHKSQVLENESKESCGNKFDRYDNSDDSESDLDEDSSKSHKRERKNSVDMLMDELQNEINMLEGKKQAKLEENRSSDNENKTTEKTVSDEVPPQNDTIILEIDPDLIQDESVSPEKVMNVMESSPSPKKSKSRSPLPHKPLPKKQRSKTKSRSRSPPPIRYKSPYRSPRRSRSPPRKVRYSPNIYPRAVSPLNINTEVLNTITMAPLSPRSAAFVLENRQILARRQMSPRRSLSRESRSISPKRIESPTWRPRSPMRRSLSPRRRSISPRKRSISPRRRSISPRRNLHRKSPYRPLKRGSNSPVSNKHPVHKRLGSRPNSRNVSPYLERKMEAGKRKRSSRSISLSLSPSPDRNYHKRPLNETTGHVNSDIRNRREKSKKDSPKLEAKLKDDPILEARRRKFESPVQINNGIIKLKPSKSDEKEEETKTVEFEKERMEITPQKDPESEEMEENDEILDLNPLLDDLWSEEESDDGNEGRFKLKSSSENKNILALSFRKLTTRPIPKSLHTRDNSDRSRMYKKQRRRSRSPLKSTNKTEPKRDFDNKDKIDLSSKLKIDSKTIEEDKQKDKIKSDAVKNADILKIVQSDKNVKRKVKIQEKEDIASNVENTTAQDIAENQDSIVTKKEDDGGDLRAELSRRRAQRLIKAGSLAESLPTRLLKNALQEVVPKRSGKQSKLSKGSGSSVDRKVLIVKRFASSTAASEVEPTNKVGNKEGKLPIHMRLGSNPDVEESVRLERRNKRRRTNPRKKQVQVVCLLSPFIFRLLFTFVYCCYIQVCRHFSEASNYQTAVKYSVFVIFKPYYLFLTIFQNSLSVSTQALKFQIKNCNNFSSKLKLYH